MAFDIRIENIKEIADDINSLSSQMGEMAGQMNILYFAMSRWNDYCSEAFLKEIATEKKKIAQFQQEMKRMAVALNSVKNAYLKSENQILLVSNINPNRGENPLNHVTEKEMDEAIVAYEKEHEKEVEELNDFLNGEGADILTEEDKRNIKYLIYTAPEPYRSIFMESITKFKIADANGKSAFYKAWKHTVTYSYPDSFASDPRGAYTVFFHECGHAIDDLSDVAKWLGSDSEKYKVYSEAMGKDVTMRQAIEYDVYYNDNNEHSITSIANRIIASGGSGSKGDVHNVIDALKQGSGSDLSNADLLLYNAVKSEFTSGVSGATYEAVSDVYGGMSGNELRSGYGHDTSYWEDDKKAAKELWAEYFSYNMAGDDTSLNLVYEYFPEATKIMNEYTKALGA